MGTDSASFDIDIDVPNATTVESAAAALTSLTQRLTESGAAAQAAADAVKAGEVAYRQAETSAERAAKAVEKIGLAVEAQRGKMKAALDAGDDLAFWKAATAAEKLNQRQAEAVAKANEAKAAMDREASALDKLRNSAASAAAQESKVSEAATKAAEQKKKLEELAELEAGSGNAKKAAGAFRDLGGPIGFVGQKLFDLKDTFGDFKESLGSSTGLMAAGAAGIAAIAVAVIALGIAAASTTIKITSWALGLADAARTSVLLSDGIAGSVAGGRALDAKLAELQTRVPQTREELLGMAGDLAKSGLQGNALASALDDAAVKAAKLKWGPDFAKQTLSLTNQADRFKSNVAGVFGGLKIDGLLEGVSKLVGLFDSSTESGHAMKVVFESVFQPLIDGATDLVPKIERAFIILEIWAMKGMIALKPYGSTILQIAEGFGIFALGVVGLVVIVGVLLVAALAAAGAATYLFWEALNYIEKQAMAFGTAISNGIGQALAWLKAKMQEAKDWLSSISLSDIGKALMDGLVAGITGAAGNVVGAVKGAVGGAITAAEGLLKIGSPSKVFEQIGAYTGEGMAIGVDKSSGVVQSALETMVAPPDAQQGGGAAGGGGGSADFSGAIFNFYGVEGAEDAESRLSSLLTSIMEGDLSQLGGGVPA